MNHLPPAIILVNPQMGENIGAAARVMHNFGVRDLRLVAPRDGWPNQSAVTMASGATEIVEAATVFPSLEAALHDIHYVAVTTARRRELATPVASPREAISTIANYAGQGIKTALVFGPERTGVENDAAALANVLISIPVNPAYASLNLAQSVGILCYEYKMAESEKKEALSLQVPASKEDLLHLMEHLEQELDVRGFYKTLAKKPKMVQNLRAALTKAHFTDQEVRTLRGVIRCLTESA